eukprot:COSAG01_NODE_8155_length_2898_cov_5.062522_2_plen_313_part_00
MSHVRTKLHGGLWLCCAHPYFQDPHPSHQSTIRMMYMYHATTQHVYICGVRFLKRRPLPSSSMTHTAPPPVPRHILDEVIVRRTRLGAGRLSGVVLGKPPRLPSRAATRGDGAAAKRASWISAAVRPGVGALMELCPSWRSVVSGAISAVPLLKASASSDASESDSDAGRAHWVSDDSRPDCTACARQFGLFLRRHHCRSCGGLFCHDCSSSGDGERSCEACLQLSHLHRDATDDCTTNTAATTMTTATTKRPLPDNCGASATGGTGGSRRTPPSVTSHTPAAITAGVAGRCSSSSHRPGALSSSHVACAPI